MIGAGSFHIVQLVLRVLLGLNDIYRKIQCRRAVPFGSRFTFDSQHIEDPGSIDLDY